MKNHALVNLKCLGLSDIKKGTNSFSKQFVPVRTKNISIIFPEKEVGHNCTNSCAMFGIREQYRELRNKRS